MQLKTNTIEFLLNSWDIAKGETVIADESRKRGLRDDDDTTVSASDVGKGLIARELKILPELIKMLESEFVKFKKEFMSYDQGQINKIKKYIERYKEAIARYNHIREKDFAKRDFKLLEEVAKALALVDKQKINDCEVKMIADRVVAGKGNIKEMMKMQKTLEDLDVFTKNIGNQGRN